MNLVQMNIMEAYAILQYSVIVVAVEIENVNNKPFMFYSSLSRSEIDLAIKQCFLTKIYQLAIPVWELDISTGYF